jgi:hypothetical protein
MPQNISIFLHSFNIPVGGLKKSGPLKGMSVWPMEKFRNLHWRRCSSVATYTEVIQIALKTGNIQTTNKQKLPRKKNE